MKPSPPVEAAQRVLINPARKVAEFVLAPVNLTLLEREIITRSEIDGTPLEAICNSMRHWNNPRTVCSYANCVKIKRRGMIKIAKFLECTNGL